MGFGGKFLNFMECFYEVTFSAVKLNESVTDWFEMKAGVRQGQNESPTLFALFINSLAQLIKDLNFGVRYENLNVSILLYADDIVLLAETEEDLQRMLNVLAE